MFGFDSDGSSHDGVDRRGFLKCMAWAGTGVVWTVSGGLPRSLGLIGSAAAAETGAGKLTFVQMSDSHIGFSKEANPDVTATLKVAVDKIKAMPDRPAFLLHTGDITQLSKPDQFDTATQLISGTGLDTHYVPGEHDLVDDAGTAYLDRYGKGTKGSGYYSFDFDGVHFIGLVNVVNLKPGGLGRLGAEQLAWLESDLKDKTASTPIVVFAHIPLWAVYPEWGWGTEDSAKALSYLKRFGSVTVLNGHIHQVLQKVEGNVAFHTAPSTAFVQPAPGQGPSPGPMKVPADQLRKLLGVTDVSYVAGKHPLALIDQPLES